MDCENGIIPLSASWIRQPSSDRPTQKALSSSHDYVPEETAGMQWVEDATDIEVVLAITYEACSGRWAVQTP